MTERTKRGPGEKCSKQLRRKCSSGSSNSKLETPRLPSGAASDRPEMIEIPKLPQIPEVVWHQPSETSTNQLNLNDTNNASTSNTTVASQTSRPKGTEPQNYVVATEQYAGNQTGNKPVPFLNCSNNCPIVMQKSEQRITITLTGDTTIPPLTTTTLPIEEGLVRDEQTNEVYFPLTSTVVLKRKQERLYVPLDFEKNRTVDALADSGSFVSAIALNELDTIKEKDTPLIIFSKSMILPNFRYN